MKSTLATYFAIIILFSNLPNTQGRLEQFLIPCHHGYPVHHKVGIVGGKIHTGYLCEVRTPSGYRTWVEIWRSGEWVN